MVSIAVFLPTIINNLGHINTAAQLMVVPVFAVGRSNHPAIANTYDSDIHLACVVTVLIGWLSRQFRIYSVPLIFCLVAGIIATALLQHVKTPTTQYGLTFLLASVIYPAPTLTIGWISSNVSPVTKRGAAIGIAIACSNAGGILGSFTFMARDAHNFFRKGFLALMVTLIAALVITLGLVLHYYWDTRTRPALSADMDKYARMDEDEKAAEDLKGDRAIVSCFKLEGWETC